MRSFSWPLDPGNVVRLAKSILATRMPIKNNTMKKINIFLDLGIATLDKILCNLRVNF